MESTIFIRLGEVPDRFMGRFIFLWGDSFSYGEIHFLMGRFIFFYLTFTTPFQSAVFFRSFIRWGWVTFFSSSFQYMAISKTFEKPNELEKKNEKRLCLR